MKVKKIGGVIETKQKFLVVCIDNGDGYTKAGTAYSVRGELTIDKSYLAGPSLGDDSMYSLSNDRGESTFYFRKRFKPLDEIREEKINMILG